MKSHTFLISFYRAHFKRHETKKFRGSYILPPPTVVWGIFGACFGIDREGIEAFTKRNDMMVGSELCGFKGLSTEKATLMAGGAEFIRTVEDFEFLIEPTFRIAVHAKDKFVDELEKRIQKRNLEFDVYGGISDCLLKDIVNEKIPAKFEKRKRVRGMVPVELTRGIYVVNQGHVIQVKVLWLNEIFYQGFNVEFEVKELVKTINGIAIWGINDVEKFRQANSRKGIPQKQSIE